MSATKKSTATNKVPTIDSLKSDLVKKQADLLESKRQNQLGELLNPRIISKTRKEIARIKTAIRHLEISQVDKINKEDK